MQGGAVAGVIALGVVQQDRVQAVAPELLEVAAGLPALVVGDEALPGGGLVLIER